MVHFTVFIIISTWILNWHSSLKQIVPRKNYFPRIIFALSTKAAWLPARGDTEANFQILASNKQRKSIFLYPPQNIYNLQSTLYIIRNNPNKKRLPISRSASTWEIATVEPSGSKYGPGSLSFYHYVKHRWKWF